MHGMLEYENAYMDIDFITSVLLSGKSLHRIQSKWTAGKKNIKAFRHSI